MSTSKENKTKVKKQNYFIDGCCRMKLLVTGLWKIKKNNTKARCYASHKTIELCAGVRSALTDHAKGMKHISAVNKVSTFFQFKISKTSVPVPAKNNHVNSTVVVDSAISSNQGILDTFVTNLHFIKAEIIWSLKYVTNGFSNRANDELTETFAAIFPDSRIAKSFSLARAKSLYTVTHGLAPYLKSVLVSTLDKSDVHVYSFDESLNDVTQICEMDLHVRFWESVSYRVETR